MTSRERLLLALHGGLPDRVPVAPFGWGRIDPDSALGAEMLSRLDLLLPVGVGSGAFFGQRPPITSEELSDGRLSRLTTPHRELRQVWRRTSVTSATTEFYCRTAADLAAVADIPVVPATPDVAHYRHWCARVGDEALVLAGISTGLCIAAELLSPADLCLVWMDEPAALLDFVNLAHERMLRWTEQLCEAGVRAFRLIGGEYASTQLGPAGFSALCVPQDRELCDLIRGYGGTAYYHNHGPVRRYLELFREVGMTAIDPMEAPPFGDCDLAESKRVLGEIGLVGNLDDMELLDKLPLPTLRELAAERLEQAGRAGFVLGGTASGTYGERAVQAFFALLDVV